MNHQTLLCGLPLLILATPAEAQSYDEGVAPTRPATDAEAAQLEGEGGDNVIRSITPSEAGRAMQEVVSDKELDQTGDVVRAMTPSEAARAQEQINSRYWRPEESAEDTIRSITPSEAGLAAQQYATDRQLDQQGNPVRAMTFGEAARAAERDYICAFPHSWNIRAGGGSTVLTVDASGSASIPGLAHASASLAAGRLTVHWSTRATGGDWSGRFLVALDRSCNGEGEMILDTRPAGADDFGLRGGPASFTSRGRGTP